MSIPENATRHWRTSDSGELLVGGRPLSSIAARFGTPLFIYDHAIVERKLSALRHALPARFAISYSIKANPNPAFIRFFLDNECGLEVASGGEYCVARRTGCPTEKIVFAGPGKSSEELELVLSRGVGEIHAESVLEIERVNAISRRLGIRARIAIRVNPAEEGEGGAMRMGGTAAPFGIDEELLPALLDRLPSFAHVELTGIHLFVGTQILDHQLLVTQYKKGLAIFREAVKQVGFPLNTLDFGGGLGVPYFQGEAELDLIRLRDEIDQLMRHIESESCFAGTRFMVEPGRFLVGECGVYVSRINDIKISRGKKYLILDGGMNHHLAASGNLGQVIRRNFPMAIANKLNATANEAVDVVGPLCTPLDTLGRGVQLPTAEVGDLLVIFQSGAYARTASPLGFLSHRTPPEVWLEDGEDFLIRERSTWEDQLADTQQLDKSLISHGVEE